MTDNSTKTDDQLIGEAIRTARGNATQADLARRMSDRGHKWVDVTVVNLEKGRRALKLTEARDLAALLGIPIGRLLERPDETEHRRDLMEAERNTRRDFTSALRSLEQLLESLELQHSIINGAKRAGLDDLRGLIGQSEALLRESSPENAVEAARAARRAEVDR